MTTPRNPEAVPAGTSPRDPSPRDPSSRALFLRLALGALTVAACFTVFGYWVEAEKEARILCALSRPGTAATEADRRFGTANLLQVARDTSDARITLRVSSTRNLALTGCEVALENATVVQTDYSERFTLAPLAGGVALVAMGALALFQLALAAGAPLGRMAWGGAQSRLDAKRRVASGAVGLLLLVALAAVAQQARYLSLSWLASTAEWIVGVFTLVFTLSVFANLASSSASGAPVHRSRALLLACCGVVLLLAG